MDTNLEAGSTQKKSFTRFIPHIVRVLMGLAFLAFGLMSFMVKPPDNLPENIKTINTALAMAGYAQIASGTMVLVGLLLLVNRFVPLALALIAPILVGILSFHIMTSPGMIVPGAILSVLELFLAYSYRKAFCPMLAAKVAPSEKCGT